MIIDIIVAVIILKVISSYYMSYKEMRERELQEEIRDEKNRRYAIEQREIVKREKERIEMVKRTKQKDAHDRKMKTVQKMIEEEGGVIFS